MYVCNVIFFFWQKRHKADSVVNKKECQGTSDKSFIAFKKHKSAFEQHAVYNDFVSSSFFLVLFSSSFCLTVTSPVSLITHHSIKEWGLGDCALGEGMYPQCITSGHFQQFTFFTSGAENG